MARAAFGGVYFDEGHGRRFVCGRCYEFIELFCCWVGSAEKEATVYEDEWKGGVAILLEDRFYFGILCEGEWFLSKVVANDLHAATLKIFQCRGEGGEF